MNKPIYWLTCIVFLIIGAFFISCSADSQDNITRGTEEIQLPQPNHTGDMSVEEAIFRRRSVRRYKDEPLSKQEISQVLWAAGGKTVDGVTGATRAYPSAGGIYPVEIYLIAGRVEDLPAGIYRYNWRSHTLNQIKSGDHRSALARAALGQGMIAAAPASILFTADTARMAARYGQRGKTRYVPMDVGGAGQNVHLQAESLGLGTVIVGAFNDGDVKNTTGISNEDPLYIMPLGRK